jgi:hypothetical protein
VSCQEQSHSNGPENNSCQKIEITGSKKMSYNHDYSEDVERRSDTMKYPINWVHVSTFDCLNKTKRHCSLINLIAKNPNLIRAEILYDKLWINLMWMKRGEWDSNPSYTD